jgi:hypothetical protein
MFISPLIQIVGSVFVTFGGFDRRATFRPTLSSSTALP